MILLDIQLPDRTGWDVLTQLKADPREQSIPVVVVSVVDDRLQGMALGAAAYLVKPISRHQLQDTLATIGSSEASRNEPTVLMVAPEQPAALPAPVVLLAEDDENNIHTLTSYLAAKGYQVVVARNGAEALERAHAVTPALILMDIQMPGMDGVEAGELGAYLAADWGWVGVAQIGWLRRWRKRRPQDRWSVEEVTVVTSRLAAPTPPCHFLALMRQHWTIENWVHWPRDVSFHKDRLHGRQIGVALAWLRNLAINLMQRHRPGVFIPDVWSELTTHLPIALRWVLAPLMN